MRKTPTTPSSRRRRAPRRATPALVERARLFLPGRSLRLQLVGGSVAVLVALSAQSFAQARAGATTYLIQPGETLGGIAAATGVSLDALVKLNGLKNPDLIIAGQQLQLGDGTATSDSTDQVAAAVPANGPPYT